MVSSLNILHQDNFKITFSNIPTITNVNDIELFDTYVRRIIIPEFSLEIDRSFENQGFQTLHPIAHKLNSNLPNLLIEFKLVENLKNYSLLWQWMYNLKYGKNIDTSIKSKDYNCKNIIAHILDNNKKEVAQVIFNKCFCSNLSDIDLSAGTSDEMSFTASFSYEQMLFENNESYFNCRP